MVRQGYSLQFARRPLCFRGVLAITPPCRGDESAGIGATEIVPPAQSESDFYSRYFLVPKKKEKKRLWPANYSRSQTPELRPDEKVVQGDHFETDPLANMPRGLVHVAGSERRVLSHPCSPLYRHFLRFAIEGVAYQYKVLPFGLSLAPRTFTRCMDAALSPLRQMEIHILYLDDWLILAQSQAVLTLHKTLLLSQLDCLGLRVNFAKSIL